MICWKCQKTLEDFEGRVPFRSSCDYCASCLHVCVNCKHYKPGLPNDCTVPDTPMVSDREKYNFCEDFSLKTAIFEKKDDISDAARKLFGDDSEENQDKKLGNDRFNSLFGD
ncbi:MAG: hypothetical protein ACI9S8_001446 [Chlamydiales bacterium]|jgi:hypothetical protein